MECTRWHTNQQAYLEVIWKENKTDDVICLHFGVYGNICGHMIPSSGIREKLIAEVLHRLESDGDNRLFWKPVRNKVNLSQTVKYNFGAKCLPNSRTQARSPNVLP